MSHARLTPAQVPVVASCAAEMPNPVLLHGASSDAFEAARQASAAPGTMVWAKQAVRARARDLISNLRAACLAPLPVLRVGRGWLLRLLAHRRVSRVVWQGDGMWHRGVASPP